MPVLTRLIQAAATAKDEVRAPHQIGLAFSHVGGGEIEIHQFVHAVIDGQVRCHPLAEHCWRRGRNQLAHFDWLRPLAALSTAGDHCRVFGAAALIPKPD